MNMPTAFEAQLYFHALGMLSQKVRRGKLSVIEKAGSDALAGMAVQILQKTRNAFTTSCFAGPLRIVLQPYVWFNPFMIQSQILM